jgi:hypothetical protein
MYEDSTSADHSPKRFDSKLSFSAGGATIGWYASRGRPASCVVRGDACGQQSGRQAPEFTSFAGAYV